MGSFAYLRIDDYDLDEFKNHPFQYGAPEWLTIFRESDRVPKRRAYSVAATHVRDRLEVMGFTLRRTEAAYNRARREHVREMRQTALRMGRHRIDLEADIRFLEQWDFQAWKTCFAVTKRSGHHPKYFGQHFRIEPDSGVLARRSARLAEPPASRGWPRRR